MCITGVIHGSHCLLIEAYFVMSEIAFPWPETLALYSSLYTLYIGVFRIA